jgi:hypothetical protein
VAGEVEVHPEGDAGSGGFGDVEEILLDPRGRAGSRIIRSGSGPTTPNMYAVHAPTTRTAPSRAVASPSAVRMSASPTSTTQRVVRLERM